MLSESGVGGVISKGVVEGGVVSGGVLSRGAIRWWAFWMVGKSLCVCERSFSETGYQAGTFPCL